MSTVSVPIPPIPRICPPASPPLAQFSGFSPIYGMNPFLRRVCVSGCVFSAEKRGNHAHGPASRVRSLHTAFRPSSGAESNAFCPRVTINARSPARHAGCVAFLGISSVRSAHLPPPPVDTIPAVPATHASRRGKTAAELYSNRGLFTETSFQRFSNRRSKRLRAPKRQRSSPLLPSTTSPYH